MSTLEERWAPVGGGGYTDWGGDAEIPSVVHDLLGALVDEVQRQGEAIQNLRELFAMRGRPPDTGAMSRSDALKLACEHVEAMSTSSRGFQDGVKMHDKVQATERFARFLMGESE